MVVDDIEVIHKATLVEETAEKGQIIDSRRHQSYKIVRNAIKMLIRQGILEQLLQSFQ